MKYINNSGYTVEIGTVTADTSNLEHYYTKTEVDGMMSDDVCTVEDSVSSTSTEDALSANQGKLLNDRLVTLEKTAGKTKINSIWNSQAKTATVGTLNSAYYLEIFVDGFNGKYIESLNYHNYYDSSVTSCSITIEIVQSTINYDDVTSSSTMVDYSENNPQILYTTTFNVTDYDNDSVVTFTPDYPIYINDYTWIVIKSSNSYLLAIGHNRNISNIKAWMGNSYPKVTSNITTECPAIWLNTYIYESNSSTNSFYQKTYLVDQNGVGDYTTIQEAVDVANDGDTIIINPGTYEESVKIQKKEITVRGVNRDEVIILNSTGDYYTPPLWCCTGSIENMTIWAKYDSTVDYSTQTKPMYAVHLDQFWSRDGLKNSMTLRNCHIISDMAGCIGGGFQSECHVLLDRCVIEHKHSDSESSNSVAIAWHTSDNENDLGKTNDLWIQNCIITSEDTVPISFTNGNDNTCSTITLHANNNVLLNLDGTKSNYYNGLGTNLILASTNYGNNVTTINSIS